MDREPDEKKWPDPLSGPFVLRTAYSPVRGRWELVELHLEPVDPEDPDALTTTLLRGLIPSRLTVEHRRGERSKVVEFLDATARPGYGDYISDEEAERRRRLLHGSGVESRVGRPPHYRGPELRAIAATYDEAWARHERPTKAVAERFYLSLPMAAKLVGLCRQIGLLPPTVAGKSRGNAR